MHITYCISYAIIKEFNNTLLDLGIEPGTSYSAVQLATILPIRQSETFLRTDGRTEFIHNITGEKSSVMLINYYYPKW